MTDQTTPTAAQAADLSSMLPDDSLRRLAIGYAVGETNVAQLRQTYAQEIAAKDAEIAGLTGRVEGLEAQLRTARADLDRMRTGRLGIAGESQAERFLGRDETPAYEVSASASDVAEALRRNERREEILAKRIADTMPDHFTATNGTVTTEAGA